MYQTVTDTHVARLRQHPFIQRCRDGTITRRELNVFVEQHAKYSAYFTRYLCALIANLDDANDVLQLAENLAEELGFGDDQGEPHSRIFARMAGELGVDLPRAPAFPETQKLIETTFHYCKQPNPAYGLGALCLGAEAIVAPLYSDIISGFIANGIPKEQLVFFQLHVECDDDHAETMRGILARMQQERPEHAELILEGARAMIDARLDFFTGVLEGAQQPCH
ncbi:MAG: iron-containing redox enzyme family protein [Pseudomonadota bacterium]